MISITMRSHVHPGMPSLSTQTRGRALLLMNHTTWMGTVDTALDRAATGVGESPAVIVAPYRP